MDIDPLVGELLAVGRAGNPSAASSLTGAGSHAKVVLAASRMRGPILNEIAAWPVADRVALAKSFAVYEDTVGGIGSVTALAYLMRLFRDSADQGYETFAWIERNTRSLAYYAGRALDFIEPEVASARQAAARADKERQNRAVVDLAQARRAQQATGKLYNAVRRGDLKAVEALLLQGADPGVLTPQGIPLVEYARAEGRDSIANLLNSQRDLSASTQSAKHCAEGSRPAGV
jgi:hypothetical protein